MRLSFLLAVSSSFVGCLLALVVPVRSAAAQSNADDSKAANLKTGQSINGQAKTAEFKNVKAEYKIPDAISQLLQDRNYADAIKAIDDELKKPAAAKDYLSFLKARALHLEQKFDDAVAVYAALEKDFPNSPWARRARFGMAVSLARKGDYRAAEVIYREQAQYLLSENRKQEIADLYLEFADAYFKPKDELQQKPDYAKSLEFYKRALEVGPKPDRRAEVELQIARSHQLLGQHQEAINLYVKFLKDHSLFDKDGVKKVDGKTPEQLRRDIEARFRQGEAQLALGQREEARRTWQDLLSAHADAKSDRIPESAFNLSLTFGMPAPANKEDLSLGVSALESFLKKYPDHKLAPLAHLRIAQSYMHLGRNADVVKSLDRFLADARYAEKDEIADARNLLGRAYQLQKKFPEALAAWRSYLTKHPSHHAWSEVQRQIIDTEYLVGFEKRTAKQYDEARKIWGEFIAKYPLDARNPAILYQFGQMHFEQDQWDEAIADWRRLVSKYPGTNESSQGQYMIAATLEGKQGKLEEALKEYKKVNWGSHSSHAGVAVGRLTAKTLSIATERVFRSNETPTIKLNSRNIDSVTVRVFRIDLETYFRKMHHINGVEGLDISLIDPDRTVEFKVPKYAEYQQLESEIEVPLPSLKDLAKDAPKADAKAPTSGAIAVTVSSKTLEATTLLLQSDLDIIVKSSRDEVFVFAQNMVTGKQWPKARLLISNGQQVYAEATTGDDGVFKSSYKELKLAGDVRVFAVADGSVASNMVSLQGVGVAQGLADRGYIYTDRPAYRAGQLVHVRGVLRRAADDNFVIDKNKKYTVEIFDTRSRSIWQEDIKLSEHGSFRSMFALPTTSPPGTYRVLVRDIENKGHEGSFTVHEYRLEPIRLAVEADRKVYYRGEEIEGKITAKFYYGAPLAGREIHYRLSNGRLYTAKTDNHGEVRFKLPTRDFRETQVLPLTVSLPERGLNISQNFFLATQGYTLSLSTVRPVFVAGESFDVEVKARDAEGKPAAQKITLKVLEQTIVDGKVGEREIETFPLTTDEKDGAVRQTIKLAKGATYIVRAEGIDRFENPIVGQHSVQISDDEDTVRLRVLADKHSFKVGDTAAVQVHWREAPALALVTFQGAKVLDYKLVQLKTGTNQLDLPMTAKLAPNFELSIVVMTDARAPKIEEKDAAKLEAAKRAAAKKPVVRLHTASSYFNVARDLKLTLETKRKAGAKGAIRPGEELELIIKATDPQGKAVVAEISVGMVEQSLLSMFGSNVGRIDDFFRGGARQIAVRTASSVTFAYRPATRSIDKQLLAEAQRVEIAAEESARLAETDPFGGVAMLDAPAIVPEGTFGTEGALSAFDSNVTLQITQSQAVHDKRDESSQAANQLGSGYANQRFQGLAMPQAGRGVNDAGVSGGDVFYDQAGLNWADGAAASTELFGSAGRAGQLGINPQMLAQQRLINLNRSSGARMLPQQQAGQAQAWAKNGGDGATQLKLNQNPNTDNRQLNSVDGLIVNYDIAAQSAEYNDSQLLNNSLRNNNDLTNGRQFFEANSLNINNNWNMGTKDLVCFNPTNGEQTQLNFRNRFGETLDAAEVGRFAAELAKTGSILVANSGPQETGYWNPMVVTDTSGEAKLTITVPEQSTAWKINAKGMTIDSLSGEAETDIVAKKDLFGELKVPAAFVDGDDAEVGVSVHNDLLDKGNITVTLRTIIAGRTVEEKKTLNVTGKGITDLSFKVPVRRPAVTDALNKDDAKKQNIKPDDVKKNNAKRDDAKRDNLAAAATASPDFAAFELTVAATDAKDAEIKDTVRRVVPIRAFGVPVYATAGGTASSDMTTWVEGPKEMALGSPNLQIIIGPTIQRSLLDIVLGPAPACQLDSLAVASSLDVSTSDLMAAISLQKLLGTTRDANTPQSQALDARVRSALSQIISSQQDDGGWTWTGHGAGSHRFTSARVVWALSLAKKAGYKIADDRFEKAKTYLQSQIAATGETDYESKAILLHALATVGQGDFTLANRLHRNKPSLSTAALAHLALAFIEMDRKAVAKELVEDLGQRDLTNIAIRRVAATGSLPWNSSATELRALYALGLQGAIADSTKTNEQIEWLMANRNGHRWSPEKATGPAAMAVTAWYAKTRFEGEHYKLTVFVNDLQTAVLNITNDSDTQTVDVPARLLKDGKQRINFQLTGRGQYTYQAVLGGFVAADKLKNTTKNWTVRRFHEPAPLELDGQEIPRGFDVLQGSYSTFRNTLNQLPVGKRGRVELFISRQNLPSNTSDDQLEYLVVSEPLPSGVTVVESSITGGFERFELGAGLITFYVGSRSHVETIRFDVHGYLPGEYKAAPSLIRNAYRPDQIAVSEVKTLSVLPLGAKSTDEYRMSPKELFELGKRQFIKGDLKAAGPHLIELLAKWNVNSATYKESASMLLDVHLAAGPAGEIVRYFEIIKEKWPEVEIPFDKIMKVAAAYHDVGEYERSYLVYRATVESSFIRENAVAGFLEGQGEFLRSVEVMNRLLSEYPPEPYVAATSYALAQRVYFKAPNAAADAKLREKKINRVVLVQQALSMLDSFLTMYPDDPAADQAAFSLANALLELKAYPEVIARATKYAQRYKSSDFLDSYWYIVAYGHFALGEHQKALEMAKQVAAHKRIDKTSGREIESPNKWQAIYIMGQVFHSLGKAAEAVAEYLRVEDRFSDAKEAIAYFLRKEITLPEVTTVKPNEPATAELKFRNIASADIKVYRIDLMKYSLLKRNLGGITQINLSGIRPFFEKTFELGDGKDYRDRTEKLALPIKEEGAYLVVCRGGDLHASGLVLVSPLVVDVQEESSAGRVRVTVKDVVKDDYVSLAHAKVIGSRNTEFVTGQSDLRGVFVADGIVGKSTVIAQVDSGRYAFFRGQAELGPPPAAPNAPPAPSDGPQTKSPGKGSPRSNERDLLEQLEGGNRDLQRKQQDYLDNNYKPSNNGVRIEKAF